MGAHVQDLTGPWEFRQYPSDARRMRDLDGEGWMATRVPSSIYTSLVEAGQIARADLDARPEDFAHISDEPWIYRRRFEADAELLGCDRIDLVFDGLDTITQIWCNDKLIGKTDNMFIGHRFDVTELVRPGKNRVLVKFNPAAAHAEMLMKRYGKLTDFYFGHACRSYIRKAAYQFGWDWCPALPGCGIFRPVRLEGVAAARIADVHVRTIECSEVRADIAVAVELDTQTAGAAAAFPLRCVLRLWGYGEAIEQTLTFQAGQQRQSTILRIEHPQLWWPNGYGEPCLYDVEAELYAEERCVDRVRKKCGIRTVRVNRTRDAHGESFSVEVNQRPVYVRGANWIPVTLFAGSQRREDYARLLKEAAAANMNMLRVWGGGYYENEEFYDLADELGILVWQDFMFACSWYPDRAWFLDAVRTEAAVVIRRLRSRACLALWCGNNEIDWLHAKGGLGKGRKFYGKAIYQRLLPGLLAEMDCERDYIATTPIGTGRDMNDARSGTVHEWGIWSGGRPGRQYVDEERIGRFVTEFGMQSLPEPETLRSFCGGRDLRIGSGALERHNYQLDGNARLFQYTSELFGGTGDLERFAYLTQLTQARQIKRYVEHLRMHNGINRGAMFWQYNDCCAAISWSAVDYRGRQKALYYYARRFFAPVCIAVATRHGLRPDLDEPVEIARTVVINDAGEPLVGTLACRLVELDGRIVDAVDLPITAQPFSATEPLRLPKALMRPEHPERTTLWMQLNTHTGTVAENHLLYLADKYLEWPKATIRQEMARADDGRWLLTLGSDVVVKDVQISTPTPVGLSDNYFDIMPFEARSVVLEADSETAPTVRLMAVGESA
ncbi:MAG TPA: hypothetical protein P5279_05100 [Anaerohalosphaeraceae bacterium]|jgi:beta-mannosidase|nr:hypothetical protein [Anaerohalosphaeraceae bacterium]HRT49847.1 hypothetical protein [Anaerohalosphaeraceae bacterium]HRT87066.1 hypothetical protein [Anaerohalosphaeraceae bacterium]